MTVQTTTSEIDYAGDGSTVAFTVPFYFLEETDLKVILIVDATGEPTTKTLTTHYTVTGEGEPSGGVVTMLSAPAVGETLRILRDPADDQQTDYTSYDAFPAESHETALDRRTMNSQRLRRIILRCLRLDDGDPTDEAAMLLPSKANRLSKFLRFDADGELELVEFVTLAFDNAIFVETVGGTVDVITLTTSEVTAYETGQVLRFIAGGANTTNVTVNVNGLGAKAITKQGAVALSAGDIASGTIVTITYDGTRFQMLTAVIPANLSVTTIDLGNADTTLTRDAAGEVAVEGARLLKQTAGDARYLKQGRTTIPIPAAAMQSATTNGAAAANVESASNAVLYRTLDFDTTTQEFAGFVIPMPKNWNLGTVTFQPIWTAASGTGTVVFALQARALSNDDAIDQAYGTEQTSTDTLIATGDVHVGPESAAITIAGTPAVDDLIMFRIKRNVAADTLNADARLIAIRLYFTTNAADDT